MCYGRRIKVNNGGKMKTKLIIAVLLFSIVVIGQELKAPSLGDKIPAFELKSITGKNIKDTDLIGKNTVFISLRGRYNTDIWCAMCYYTYAEMIRSNLDKEMNIIFLFPYEYEQFEDWKKNYPVFLRLIEKWKNPENYDSLNEEQKQWVQTCRKEFPQDFSDFTENPEFKLDVVSDAGQKYSKRLNLFRENWDGTNVKQNVPCVMLLNKDGIIRFKYLSQHTFDRPDLEYIKKMIEVLL